MSTTKWVFGTLTLSLAAMVLVYFGVGQVLATDWRVETARTIPATPAAVAAVLTDLATWDKWSSLGVRMPESLGPQTKAEIEGAPATVGHAVVWRGPRGMATLRVRVVAADHLELEFASQDEGSGEVRVRGTSLLQWVADGDGTRVAWRDSGHWPDVAGRWFGWFGALQEHVRQIQGVSLDGLREHFVAPSGK